MVISSTGFNVLKAVHYGITTDIEWYSIKHILVGLVVCKVRT